MTTFRHRMMHSGNAIGVWIHRTFKGRLDSGSKDVHVLMLTTPGRRTGRPRSTMVRYLTHEGGYLVWGTGSGSRTDPDWFRNLRAAKSGRVEIGTTAETVVPRELIGQDRDRVWNEVVLAQVPGVEKYAVKAGRTIPVAHLRPAP
jgi:deazaflavin-dependent oxidoreductase (nitroreductase family)